MEFLKVFNETWEVLSPSVLKSAENTSLCPDTPKYLWVSGEFLRTPQEALAILAVIPLCCPSTRNYFAIQKLRDHISNMAYNYRYQGDWKIVERILSTTTSLQVNDSWEIIFEYMTSNDWFGNFVPLLVQAVKSLRWKQVYSSVVGDTRPVTQKVWRRGYNDKGSLRPSHEKGRNQPRSSLNIPKTRVKEPRSFAWFGRIT